MRELRTCDFCGQDAVGVFEVLPPELTPAEDQQRVVLCSHCRETLTEVIAPLLTRLGTDADVEVPDDARAETGASTTPSAGGAGSAGEAATVDVDAVDPAPSPPEPADHDSPDAVDGESSDSTEDSDGDDSLGGDDDADIESDGDAEGDGDTDTERERESNAEATTNDDVPPEPPQFRKVVRILQNREFPVERAEVEALASGAYDLDDDHVTEIFDYAVERGILVDDGGTLRKP